MSELFKTYITSSLEMSLSFSYEGMKWAFHCQIYIWVLEHSFVYNSEYGNMRVINPRIPFAIVHITKAHIYNKNIFSDIINILRDT
jgi:hypothetical protein